MNYRTGIGFDVHAFETGRKLILGGIEIPFEKGLAGHSDADVVLHAITDALLGSLALGDIGKHFPDSDSKYKNTNSSFFLVEAYKLVSIKDYFLGNLDVVIALQQPRLSSYIDLMRENVASILNAEVDQISIKATTTERLGFVGREEGIAALATVTVANRSK
ncbi:MAG: 2-C-methyl-D-erythritol 2,4-cyclodiphosphate synthase [Ignavibacteriaceae bacterium]|nr:2-C-methyl-D-erythritol 2,4-cyclodiphosphate synthase [Ignavibacteriaceae bacterium]